MEDFFSNSHLTDPIIQPSSQKASPFGLPKLDSKDKSLKTSNKTNTITNYFQGKTTPKSQSEAILSQEKENKMTFEEAIVQLEASRSMEEEVIRLENKENILEEEEENQKEFKEDTTQDSRRDKSKTEEITKLEEVFEEIKEITDHPSPVACKKMPRQNKNKPSFELEGFSDDETPNRLAGIKSSGPRKFQAKKQQSKDYNELLSLVQHLGKYDWLDGSHLSQKLTTSKFLSPTVIWFMICGNYFPRNLFAHKNPKESVHQRMEKLKSFIPDVPERITKNDLKTEMINKDDTNEHETIFLDNFHNDIKAYSSSNLSNDYLKRTMSARIVNSTPRTGYTLDDDEWLARTRHFIFESYQNLQEAKVQDMEIENQEVDINLLAKMDIQNLIDLYEKELYSSTIDNERLLEGLEKTVLEKVVDEEIFNKQKFDPSNSLLDLKVDFPEDENFIGLLEKKQNEMKELAAKSACCADKEKTCGGKSTGGSKFKPKILIDDMVCFICNDGDYTDEDLIVFCSRCNMSVHQGCYGIPTIPEGDWICDVCLNFEENGKYLRCPLCDKRGGAMKPCQLRADTDLFENLNPGYDTFLKSYATPEFMKTHAKTKYLSVKDLKEGNKKNEDRDDGSDGGDSDHSGFSENLYYDIQFIEDKFTDEELVNEPKPAHVWAHLTCALFVPEVYFNDLTHMTNIIGLENIPKERFKIECGACGTKRGGAITNCEKGNCKKAFHPECARRAKYFLDIRENETEQALLYHIFCEKHTPLKLRRILESKEKKMKEEIHQFFKLAEKYCNVMANNQGASGITATDPMVSSEKTRKCEKREDTDYFMSLVEKYREITAKKPCVITLESAFAEDEEAAAETQHLYNIFNITVPKSNFTKDRKLVADDEIWGIMPFKNYTPEQKYKKYRQICSGMRKEDRKKEAKMEILRKNMERARQARQNIVQKKKAEEVKVKNKETKKAKKSEETTGKRAREEEQEEEDLGILYCICKKKYGGELMTACDGCGEWFHPECMNFPEFVKMAQVTWWWCKKCCKKKGHKDDELRFEEKKGNKKMVYSKKIDEDEFETEEPEVEKKMKIEWPSGKDNKGKKKN